jgi:hypothetical protein
LNVNRADTIAISSIREAGRFAGACGAGVPLDEYQGGRSRLTDWAERQGRYGLKDKQAEMGNQGIDGQDGPWGT